MREVPGALYEAAADLLRSRTGLVFSATGRERLVAALAEALARRGQNDPVTLLARLRGDPAAVEALAAATTVGETYFLRDEPQFRWLRRELLPALCALRSATGLRVWSAGCATGEEPYSIAILLRELDYAGAANIVGSDIAPRSLLRARRAVYTRWSLRAVPPETVSRWFRRSLGQYALERTVREQVWFVRHNLAADGCPPAGVGFEQADLILCRNVLIYFDRPTIVRVVGRLLDALAPDGWLVLGASDPPIGELVPCRTYVFESGLAYQRAIAANDAVHLPVSVATPQPDLAEPVDAVPASLPADAAAKPIVADAADVSTALTVWPLPVPPQPDAARLAAERYAGRDYHEAATMAEDALRTHADSESLWITLVRSLANVGDLRRAGQAAALAEERCPHSAELAYMTAILQSSAGQHAPAAASAKRAVYLDHTLAVAHVTLGSALARTGDIHGARRAFANAVRLLRSMPPQMPVPACDGETAASVLVRVRTQQALIGRKVDAR